MIVVVEGPSAAGKTTWCRRNASTWLPEPGRGPIDEVLRYQTEGGAKRSPQTLPASSSCSTAIR